MLITTIPTHATTMCAANDTVVVVLDPSIPFNGQSTTSTPEAWFAWASYGTIRGISTCINHGGGERYHLHDINNEGRNIVVSGGENYGKYCWCRLTHPASSLWHYHTSYSSASDCAYGCYAKCSNDIKYGGKTIANSLFGSIEN